MRRKLELSLMHYRELCSVDNWDGNGQLKIENSLYDNVEKFINLIPEEAQGYIDIFPENATKFVLKYKLDDVELLVSITANSKYHYCLKGTELKDNNIISDGLTPALMQLFKVKQFKWNNLVNVRPEFYHDRVLIRTNLNCIFHAIIDDDNNIIIPDLGFYEDCFENNSSFIWDNEKNKYFLCSEGEYDYDIFITRWTYLPL